MKPAQRRLFVCPTGGALLLLLALCFLPGIDLIAADADLKPGDTIGPNNWQRIQGMVGDNFLNRIKAGHSIQIKAPKVYRPLKEYADATEKYSGKVRLGANGELLGYTAGQPFPKLDLSDAQIGQKLAWNFFWRWLGDDYKTGGAVKGGKIIRSAIEKDGAERRADLVSYFLFPRTRYNLDPKPAIPGYEHIDYMQLRVDSYPRDAGRHDDAGNPLRRSQSRRRFVYLYPEHPAHPPRHDDAALPNSGAKRI